MKGDASFDRGVSIPRGSEAKFPERNSCGDEFLEKTIEWFLVDWMKIVDVRRNPSMSVSAVSCVILKANLAVGPEISTSQGIH